MSDRQLLPAGEQEKAREEEEEHEDAEAWVRFRVICVAVCLRRTAYTSPARTAFRASILCTVG